MKLESSQIVTIDAIMITGLLIIMTVSSSSEYQTSFLILGALATTPFAISALTALYDEYKDEKKKFFSFRTSYAWLGFGFFALIMFMALIIILEIIF